MTAAEKLFTWSINWVRVKSTLELDGLAAERADEAVIIIQHLLYNDSFISPSAAIPLLIGNLFISPNGRTVGNPTRAIICSHHLYC